MNSREIAYWQAYETLSPYCQENTDFLIAQLTALTYNTNRVKNARSISVWEVLGKPQPSQTESQIENQLRLLESM